MKSQYELQLEQDRELVNRELDRLLTLRGTKYDSVLEAMRYSVMNAGKRVRPVLVMEFCRLFGGKEEDALALACGIEMIHCYSLIHDDLPCMDDDDLRRGKPSCHKMFGEATALLAGDALLTMAFQTLSQGELAQKDPQAALRCVGELARFAGADGMVGGQVIDLAMENCPCTEETTLRMMHRLKTGALLQAACRMGAIAAGAAEYEADDASRYGISLGLAFQTVDDILDVTGTEEELGKPIGSDAENQKVTFVSLYGLEAARRLAEQETEKALAVLEKYPGSECLKELTKQLLIRTK